MSDDFDDPIFDMSNAGAQDRGSRQGGNPRESSGPSEKQLAFARTLAGERNEPLPEGIADDWRVCRDFIDRMLKTPRPAGASGGGPAAGGGGGGTRPPSDKQIAFARKLAAERQTEVPETALKDGRACSTFIDEMLAKKPAPGASAPAAPAGGGSAKPPSDKQIAFAQKLSREKGLRLPEGFQQDWRICRDFIDQALGKSESPPPAQSHGHGGAHDHGPAHDGGPGGYDGPPAYDGPPDDGPPW